MPDRRAKIGMKVRIPADLHAQITLLLLDDRTGLVEYGSWTGLMEMLLRRWLDEQRASANDTESLDDKIARGVGML